MLPPLTTQAELEARLISDMNLDDATLLGLSDSLKP